MPPTGKRAAKKKAPTPKKAAASSGKQQTIADSLKRSALRRKDKAPAAKKHEERDDDGGESDDAEREEGDGDEAPAKPQRAVAKGKKRAAQEPLSGSEQEEKDEERGPRRERGASGASASRNKSTAEVDVDQILTGSFLLTAGNSSELSRRLKQTWGALQQIPNQQQDEEVPLEKLRLVCTELLHDKVLEHLEKNVRSLASCCFVELLRIYAPDMPFKSNEELYDAFQLILEQLRSLAIEDHDAKGKTASTDLHHLYVLESLANFRSCLLLLGMDYVPDESDEPLLVQLFRTLFNTIRKEHLVKIENLMVSIMVSCIEESDTIEQSLLDAILSPLVHSNPSAETNSSNGSSSQDVADRGPYHMAQELIRRTSDQLQSHISHFFNSVLVDAPSSFQTKASELKEHVYTLIYEVHKVNSSLLLYVLPNVCMQLQVDEVATRSEAIALMGRLFASSHAEYGQDYMKNFRDFLGRFRDVSKEIRLQMVQVSAIIWQRKPELASLIEKEFVARLADPEWEVRRLAVNEVCDLAANNLDAVSEECLRQVGERMKDKRVVLRKETMTGLSQVYAAHISAYWSPEDEDAEEDDNDISLNNVVPTAHSKKLGWVPDYVLKCFAYPQQELKLRVIQLLDDILLPKAASEHARAKGLLYIYHSLDATAREALRRLFVERAKCLSSVEAFLTARKVARKGVAPSQQSEALISAKTALQSAIAPLFSETENLSKLLDQLVSWKDQSVFKQLELLCDFSRPQDEYRSARDRLVKAVGSKSPLGEFLKNFCRKLNMLTVSEATIGSYLRFFVGSGIPQHRENRTVTDLLLIVSRTTPQLFARFVQDEIEAILVENDDSASAKAGSDDDEDFDRDNKVVICILNVLAHFSEFWSKQQQDILDLVDRRGADSTPSDPLKHYLKQCCLGLALKNTTSQDDGAAAKFSAQILANFFGEANDVGSLVTKLCSKKVLVSPSAPTAISTLQSLHVFAKRCPLHLFHNADNVDSLWQVLMENYILQEKQESTASASKLKKSSKTGYTVAKAAEVRCLAIKVASDLLLYGHEGNSSNLRDRSRELLKLLFELLRSDGRMWGSAGSLPAKYRTAASCNTLKLLRHRGIESSLTVSEWHILGFVVQDSSEDVRKAFLKKLSANLMKNSIPHPHKYLSYLVLAATEQNGMLKKTARGLLSAAVERMRRVFEATSSRTAHPNSDEGDDEERQNANALMVPEYALPYVIHLLAHHPDYPSAAAKAFASGSRGSVVSDPAWGEQVAYLDFFINGLMPSNSAEADNIAFLLQILTKLSDCHDSSDPNGVAIYPLAECAVALLKRRIKNQSNLKAFPGKIYLPKQLYSSGKGPDKRLSITSNSAIQDDEEKAHLADPPRKKSRITASLSPIKPSGATSTFISMNSPPLSARKQKPSPGSTTKSRRRSLQKSPATPTTTTLASGGDEVTPNRRQSLMRKARSQAKTFVEDSESEDDADNFVPRPSVASRAKRRDSAETTVSLTRKSVDAVGDLNDSDEDKEEKERPSASAKRRRGSSQGIAEETQGTDLAANEEDEEEEMTSFRASRRRRKS